MFQGGAMLVRENLGIEFSFPHAGDTQVLHRVDEGEEVLRGVTVGLGGCSSRFMARSSRRMLSKRPFTVTWIRSSTLCGLCAGFVRYRSLPSCLFRVFLERLPLLPRGHASRDTSC